MTPEWCASLVLGAAPIGVREVAARVRHVTVSKQYRDNPALVAIKVLDAAGVLTPLPTIDDS